MENAKNAVELSTLNSPYSPSDSQDDSQEDDMLLISDLADDTYDQTDINTGLGSKAAARRLKHFGLNTNPFMFHQDPSSSQWPVLSLTANTLASGLISMIIYLTLSIVGSLWWQVLGMGLLLGYFLLLTLYHIVRWRWIKKYMNKRLQLRSRVLRDGIWRDIPSRELVPGDIIELSAGKIVPAHCVVRECSDNLIADNRSILTDRKILTDISESLDSGVIQVAKDETLLAGSMIKSGEAYRAQVLITGPRAFLHHNYNAGVQSYLRKGRRKDLVYAATRSLIFLVAITFVIAVGAALLTAILTDRQLSQVLATATGLIVYTAVNSPVGLVLRYARTEGARKVANPHKTHPGALMHQLATIELLAAMETLAVDTRGYIETEEVKVTKLMPMQYCTASGLLLTAALSTTPEAQAAASPMSSGHKAPVGDMEHANMAILEELDQHIATDGYSTDPYTSKKKMINSTLAKGEKQQQMEKDENESNKNESNKNESNKNESNKNKNDPKTTKDSTNEAHVARKKRPRTGSALRNAQKEIDSRSDKTKNNPSNSSSVDQVSPKKIKKTAKEDYQTDSVVVELSSPDIPKRKRKNSKLVEQAQIQSNSASISPNSSSDQSNKSPYVSKSPKKHKSSDQHQQQHHMDPCLDHDLGEFSPMELHNYSRLGALFPPGCTVVHLKALSEEALRFARDSNPTKCSPSQLIQLEESSHRFESILDDDMRDPNAHEKTFLVAKGDPRSIIRLCVEKENEPLVSKIEDIVSKQSERGRTVIAVAKGRAESLHILEEGPPSGLNLVGLVCLEGKLHPDSGESLGDAYLMGLNVKLISEGSLSLTTAIGKRLFIGENMITVEDMLASDPNLGGSGVDLDAVDGFAEVTPENKIHIALASTTFDESFIDPVTRKLVKSRKPPRKLWGITASDPSILYEADIGIAHRSDSDVAVQSADVIVMEPGMHGLTRAIAEARKAMYILEALSICCGVQSIRNIITLVAAWVTFGIQPIETTSLLILVALNIPMLLGVAHFDNAPVSKKPPSPFLIRKVAFTTFAVTLLEVISAFLLAILMYDNKVRGLTTKEANTCAFLWFGLANGFMVILCRSPKGLIFKRPWPHPFVVMIVFASQVIVTLFAIFGWAMTPVGVINALLVWSYVTFFFLCQNIVFYASTKVWKLLAKRLDSGSWFLLWHKQLPRTQWYRGLLTG